MKNDWVILVDENDHEIGQEKKLTAHKKGVCHRAFSIFIFFMNHGVPELLLQQRHNDKYHSGGLWTNSCCSHPRVGENTKAAAKRRLKEELGLTTPLTHVGEFHYIAHLDNGLTENEYDHVFVGFSDSKKVVFDPKEVAAIRWMTIEELNEDFKNNTHHYTPWFKKALDIALNQLT